MPLAEPILFPDAELWATAYLRPLLVTHGWTSGTAVYVSNKVPSPRRPRMVIVRRDGGRRLDAVRDLARLSFRVWGSTEQEATDLANVVRALLGAALNDAAVRRVSEQSGPSPIPDESDQPLRFMVTEFVLRGGPL